MTALSASQRTNLPAPVTHLIGRDQESRTVADLVLRAPTRLITLTGTGGCGKTQLALFVAAGLVDAFEDGVWLVELAAVQASHLVPYAVAAVLGTRERASELLVDTLLAHLKTRQALLVLDNCEHLIDACASLAERLLAGCPRVRLLATSRERLRINAEVNWRVPSLASPDRRANVAPMDLLTYPAVRLFVERAQAVRSDFALGPANAPAVVAICARLEGLPLALELAAAHVSALALPQILERLDSSFRLLVGGSRTAPTRQQTLRATLDWSYGLLSTSEQAVFQRLAVFAGGWSVEAAEHICADADVASTDVLELLARLVDKSLVVGGERDGRSRYRLLEPIRQYAREHLAAAGELEAVRRRHATFFLAFAEGLERDVSVGGAQRQSAADALEADYPNLQVALRLALDTQDAELGLRLARTLQFIWKFRIPPGEGCAWLEELLALPGAQSPTPDRTVSLLTAARLAWERGDHAAADRYYAIAVPLARQLHDPWILFVALVDQGLGEGTRGDYAQARALLEEALPITRSNGDAVAEAIVLLCLGRLHIFQGDFAKGRAQCEESSRLARQFGDDWVTCYALLAVAMAALAENDVATARVVAYEGLNLQASVLMRTGMLFILGQVEIADGEYPAARAHLTEALDLLRDSGDSIATAQVLEALGHLAACLGRPDLALRLVAAAERAHDTPDVVWSRSFVTHLHLPLSVELRDRWLTPLRSTLDPDDAARWWAEGCALSLAEAVVLGENGLNRLVPGQPDVSPLAVPQTALAPGLTQRELEVLRLVAKGLSNKEIAAELVLSVRTVERHITNLYGKIGARGKADATAYAIHHGLM